jgi:diacylglycerol kinase (ATP)
MYVIANPVAGGGKRRPLAQSLVDRIPNAQIHWTEHPGHATELARQGWASGARSFVVLGGDGTVFEVINGLFPLQGDERPTLGIVPIGTGNSFVRDFGMTTPEHGLQAVLNGQSQAVDVVRVEHADGVYHYLNLLSVGFTADAGELTNRRFKALGLGGYAVAVLIRLTRLGTYSVPYQLDDGPIVDRPCTLLSFSNSRFTGGTMEMAPPADATDGLVDLVDVAPMRRRRLLACFPRIYQGTHVTMEETSLHRAKTVTFPRPAPTDVMVDGEILRQTLHKLEVQPGAVDLFA